MAINVVTNPYHSLEKIKETHRKMFSETNYMEQVLQKSSGFDEN